MESTGRDGLRGPEAVARSLDHWEDRQWLALDLIKAFNEDVADAVSAADRTVLALSAVRLLSDLFDFATCAYFFVPEGSSEPDMIAEDLSPDLVSAYADLKKSGKLRRALRAFPPSPRHVAGSEHALLVAPVDFHAPTGHHFAALLHEDAQWGGMRGRMMEFVLDQIQSRFAALERVERDRHKAESLRASVVEKDQQLSFFATHDQLTGVLSREKLLEETDQLIEQSESVFVVSVGLRGFARVHHRFGYAAGDGVMLEIARRLEKFASTSLSGFKLGRIGDERFALAGSMTADDTAEQVCDTVNNAISGLCTGLTAGGEEIALTAYAGVAFTPTDAVAAFDAVNASEFALNAVDHAVGANIVLFSSLDPGEREDNSLFLESEINASLERGDFELWYQPKIDLNSERVVGAEALMRWQHPSLGRVSPVQFIPAAERSGQIIALGDLALRHACRQVAMWRSNGFDPGLVSVNLSPIQVASADLPTRFRAILQETGVSADQLELEVTETAVSRDIDVTARVIAELHALGFTISIDDFGTGYSSLLLLRQLPIDVIKIDRAFIRNLPGNSDDLAIVRAVLSMAADLGLKVIAEGVEDAAQFACLRDMGCDQMQGALASMPVPRSTFSQFVRDWKGLDHDELNGT